MSATAWAKSRSIDATYRCGTLRYALSNGHSSKDRQNIGVHIHHWSLHHVTSRDRTRDQQGPCEGEF